MNEVVQESNHRNPDERNDAAWAINRLKERQKEQNSMKRTKKPTRKPTAILTGDWHLREDQPICRTDDYWTAQSKKLQFIRELQRKYDCFICHSGDLFHHWKPSPLLLSEAMLTLQRSMEGPLPPMYSVFGNHDLPQHNIQLSFKTGLTTLQYTGLVDLLNESHWEQIPDEGSLFFPETNRNILVWHVMTWTGERPWPGCGAPTAEEILDRYPQFDLILTGHNHKTFVVEQDERLLVNPGSMMRMAADQEDYEPCVFLWYAETNEVERVVLPHEKGVVSRNHIEAHENRDDSRYQAFIKGLQEDAPQISFRANLEDFFRQHTTTKKIKEMIWESLG